jgi:hypothetical protein
MQPSRRQRRWCRCVSRLGPRELVAPRAQDRALLVAAGASLVDGRTLLGDRRALLADDERSSSVRERCSSARRDCSSARRALLGRDASASLRARERRG